MAVGTEDLAGVRIYTRPGADWTERFQAIVDATSQMKAASFYLDGEACDGNGVALFDKLHTKANDDAVFLYAFDLLESGGEDLRPVPLEERKVLSRRKVGIVLQRASGRRRRDDLPSRVPAGPGGCCLEAPRPSVSVGPCDELAQNQESKEVLRAEDGTF